MGVIHRGGGTPMIDFQIEIDSSMVTKAGHKKLMKRLNRTVMTRHAVKRLPRHFEVVPETRAGVGGYRYRARFKEYIDRKERKYRHRKPNVLTGKLRQAVLSRVKITATQYHGTLSTRGTAEHPLAEWQKREIETVSNRERKEMVRWFEKQYKRLAKTKQYKSKYRRRT